MGRASREKGKRGEREVRDVFRAAGLTEADRAGWRQVRGEAVPDVVTVDEFHVEVKRCERVELPKWLRQAEAAAAVTDSVPVVAYRQNGEPWRAVLPLDALAELVVLRSSQSTTTTTEDT